MPGKASLDAGQYYAHSRNAFWRIMGELVEARPDLPYPERIQILQARGIAVWDMLKACVRPGSGDIDISAELPNDLATFFSSHRQLTHVGLNGGKAAAFFMKYAARHCPGHVHVKRLPSTSPAYAAMDFAGKCAAWRAALPWDGRLGAGA
jgi:TDG/mug DNA glycosylase family protein